MTLDREETAHRLLQIRSKLGLYPLSEDVIISLPLYHLIVAVLTEGTPEDQQKVAEMMRLAFTAPFPPQ